MSPASVDALEVERYIGACLFSQNRSKNFAKSREVFQRTAQIYHQNGYVGYQGCSPVERWAGGAPLISFAGPPRGGARRHNNHQEESPNSHLARLAVHTQGAPLILAKSYNHRKTKPQRNNGNAVQQTKVFENSYNKNNSRIHEPANESRNSKGADSVSVTSDESSGSQNSETCLPRIIKPRKRRKKDRKPPPHLNRSHHNQEDFSNINNASPDMTFVNISPYLPYIEPLVYQPSVVKAEENDILGDTCEAPRLHHTFEEVEEVEDVNGNQPVSTCQCRYCDPEGQIWDVDRSCYSPFLTPPKAFDFSNSLFSFSDSLSTSDSFKSLSEKLSSLSLRDEKCKPPFSRSASSSSTSSSLSSTGDLEVSTEIVTSLNGHRDIEIKFWLTGAVDSKSTNSNNNNDVSDLMHGKT